MLLSCVGLTSKYSYQTIIAHYSTEDESTSTLVSFRGSQRYLKVVTLCLFLLTIFVITFVDQI